MTLNQIKYKLREALDILERLSGAIDSTLDSTQDTPKLVVIKESQQDCERCL